MGVNQVYYGDDPLIDLTEDTVTPETLLQGATAHNAAGNQITGTAIQGNSDKTPVGVVVSVSTPTAQTGEFPNKNYLVCDGGIVNISDYPQLAQYFQTYYGSINYFGGDGITTFKLPDYSRDYPQNGVLCIKAAVSSDVITVAEVDETGISSREDQVPNCARVAEIESNIDSLLYQQSFKNSSGVQINAKSKATIQIDCTVSGYRQLGVIGLYTGNIDPEVVPQWYEFTSGSMLGVSLTNLSSSAKTIAKDQVQVKILYKKN